MTNKVTKKKKAESAEKMSFEEMLNALEEIVFSLESGGLSLEDSLAAYEKATEYSKKLNEQLDAGEKRISELTKSGEKAFIAEDLT